MPEVGNSGVPARPRYPYATAFGCYLRPPQMLPKATIYPIGNTYLMKPQITTIMLVALVKV